MTNETEDSLNKSGRPKKIDGPKVNYIEVDRLLVMGEMINNGKESEPELVYPSYRELAERYNVSNSVIAEYAKKHDCLRRRERTRERMLAKTEEKLLEMRAEAIAFSKEDALATIDSYLLKFRGAVAEGRVRVDSPADFNMLLRLKEFIMSGADSRAEIHAALSLENLQARHRQMLKTSEETSDAERGVVGSHVLLKTSLNEQAAEVAVPPLLSSAIPLMESSGRFSDVGDRFPEMAINQANQTPSEANLPVDLAVGFPANVAAHDGQGRIFDETKEDCSGSLVTRNDCELTPRIKTDEGDNLTIDVDKDEEEDQN